jgi:hypothetical protein
MKTVHYIIIAVAVVIIIAIALFRKELKELAGKVGQSNTATNPTATGSSAPSAPAENCTNKVLNDDLILRQGSRGCEVRYLQSVVGAQVDGIFGPLTLQALRKWLPAFAPADTSEISIRQLRNYDEQKNTNAVEAQATVADFWGTWFNGFLTFK